MSDKSNPVVELILRISRDVFDRMYKGQLDYDRDTAVTRKHIQLAKDMKRPDVVGQLYITLGFVEDYFGHIAAAMQNYDEADQIFRDADLPYDSARLELNRGELYREAGRYQEALAAYSAGLTWLKQVDSKPYELLLKANSGLALVALRQYREAEAFFLDVLVESSDEPKLHSDSILEARRGLGEVYAAKKQYEQAWSNARMAMDMARSMDDTLTEALINLTFSHIAELDPDTEIDAEGYFAVCRHSLESQSPSILARVLLEEARDRQRRGKSKDAHQLAQEAYNIFAELERTEDAEIAKAVLGAI